MFNYNENELFTLLARNGIDDPEQAMHYLRKAYRERQRQKEIELFDRIEAMCDEQGVSTSRLITYLRKLRVSQSANGLNLSK